MVVNPLLIANFAKLSLRKPKTDKKGAMTIARFLLDYHEEISQLSISQGLQDLGDLSRERESLFHLISATKVETKRVLRTTFPELESIGNLYTGPDYPPKILISKDINNPFLMVEFEDLCYPVALSTECRAKNDVMR